MKDSLTSWTASEPASSTAGQWVAASHIERFPLLAGGIPAF